MTTAAAFMCRDGMVICTDTELTLGDALKYSQGKIRFLVADGSAVVMTGAGHWDYMEMAFEKIAERFRSYVSKADITGPEFKSIIEDVILDIYGRHISAYPGEQKPSFSLLLAIHAANGEEGIIKTSDTAIAVSHHYEIVGTGLPFGKYLADSLCRNFTEMSSRQGAVLAAYILWVAKNYVPYVGQSSTIVTVSADGDFFFLGGIQALEERFAKWGSLILPLFLAAPDTRVSQDDFEAKLKAFTDEIRHLRADWKLIPILEPEIVKIKKVSN